LEVSVLETSVGLSKVKENERWEMRDKNWSGGVMEYWSGGGLR